MNGNEDGMRKRRSRRQTLAMAVGIVVTAALMVALAATVWLYSQDPDNPSYMVMMGALSSGMMVFLIIFALVYTKPDLSATEQYMEEYRGICSRCGGTFGEDGVCIGCGRRRPGRRGQ